MIESIGALTKHHYLAVILAIVVGVMSIAPHMFFVLLEPSYAGIHMAGADAETHYVTRIREIYDGHFSLGNAFLPDKNAPYLQPGLGEIIIATIGKILFLDAADMNIAAKFIFPPILFLLVYFFAYRMFLSKRTALLAASAVLLGQNLIMGPDQLAHLPSYFEGISTFLPHTRPISPQISSIFLYISLILLFFFTNRINAVKSKWFLIYGLVSGITIYIYFYIWSFLVVLTAFYLFYFAFKRIKRWPQKFFLITLPHIIITVPYWINFLQARVHPGYENASAGFGLVNARFVVFSDLLAILVVILFFFWPKAYLSARTLTIFAVISLWILTNQQLITGLAMQYSHYHWQITKPLFAVVISALFIFAMDSIFKGDKMKRFLFVIPVALLFVNGIFVQAQSYFNQRPIAVESQRYKAALSFLDNQYEKSLNVWTINPSLSELITSYTKHDASNAPHAIHYLNKENYIRDSVFLEYKLAGVRPEEISAAMEQDIGNVARRIFSMYYREKYSKYEAVERNVFFELVRQYKVFYEQPFKKNFEFLAIDLVLWDEKYSPRMLYGDTSFLREVAEIGDGFILYEVYSESNYLI